MSNAERISNCVAPVITKLLAALRLNLLRRRPDDCELQYETACVHDYLGREAQAVPSYLAAIAGTCARAAAQCLPRLGSTYRALGQYQAAERTLREGPGALPRRESSRHFSPWPCTTLASRSVRFELLLAVLAETSADQHVSSYREAILFYAQDIDRSWRSRPMETR